MIDVDEEEFEEEQDPRVRATSSGRILKLPNRCYWKHGLKASGNSAFKVTGMCKCGQIVSQKNPLELKRNHKKVPRPQFNPNR